MQAYSDKFQAIAVGKKTFTKSSAFKTNASEITCDEIVKHLGIDIDQQLNFNFHIISNICKKLLIC
jgi:hypothetical protein